MKKSIAKKVICSMLVLSPILSSVSVVHGADLNPTDINNEINTQMDNEQLIENGIYTIGTYIRPENVFQVSRSTERHVIVNPFENLSNQQWKIEYDKSKGAYQILTQDSLPDQVLAWNRHYDNYANDIFCTPNMNYDEHYWLIEKAADDVCYIIRSYADPNYVLDLTDYSPEKGTKIGIIKKHDNNSGLARAQFFHFNKIEG